MRQFPHFFFVHSRAQSQKLICFWPHNRNFFCYYCCYHRPQLIWRSAVWVVVDCCPSYGFLGGKWEENCLVELDRCKWHLIKVQVPKSPAIYSSSAKINPNPPKIFFICRMNCSSFPIKILIFLLKNYMKIATISNNNCFILCKNENSIEGWCHIRERRRKKNCKNFKTCIVCAPHTAP